MVGMMLLQDASRFAWLPGDERQYDLVVTLDDATSAVYSGFIVAGFRAVAEVIDRHGLFSELYTDRGSHYFHTPKAGEPVSKSVQTQVGRALAQLGIRHIAASPEARGRSERAFRTLQDRLPKELALAGITTLLAEFQLDFLLQVAGGRCAPTGWLDGSSRDRPNSFSPQGAGQVVPLVGAALLQDRHDQIHEVLKTLGRHDAAQIEVVDVSFLDPGDQIVGHLLGRTDDRRVAAAQPHPANYSSQRPRLCAHCCQGLVRRPSNFSPL
jgi:hypothetical protein